MPIEGMWTMTEDGEFELAPEYAERLLGARLAAADGWRKALVAYLEPICPYTAVQLESEMYRRVRERDSSPAEFVDELVLEALGGDLMPR